MHAPGPKPSGEGTLDIIFIEALRVETVIGIYDWERRIRQPVVIDLEMGTDIARAAANDDFSDALDYKAVSKRVQQFVAESSFFLVETLTERVAALILDEFAVPWVRVKLNKVGALRGAKGVGIVIERGRRPE
ncbi:MAG: dihydroneopterin aldolase [Thiotrichales bacterium]|nr:dihydroneopterin aldolase [Thiotrichales bacterium]MCY4285249.1 dihydroneopterin aldolase [Thiotrichales bacterium]MCY4349627.1 dihydroneopterin aldolase [Thiotrichales bacterium]